MNVTREDPLTPRNVDAARANFVLAVVEVTVGLLDLGKSLERGPSKVTVVVVVSPAP